MFKRNNGPGAVAAWARSVGDVDMAIAGPLARVQLVRGRRDSAVNRAEAAGVEAARPTQEKIAKVDERLESRARRRQVKADRRQAWTEQGRLWRAAGIEERLVTLHWPALVRILVGAAFAAVDFYIFARAYAYLDRSGGTANFVIGGVLGLFTFVVGLLLAHGLKTFALSRAQRSLLADRPEFPGRERLVVTRPGLVWTATAGTVFAVLAVLVAAIRYEGLSAPERNIYIALVQALVPVVAVLAELWLYNPAERPEPQPNWIDRRLDAQRALLARQLQAVQERTGHLTQSLRDSYGVEEQILVIEQDDMYLGFVVDEPRTSDT